MSKQEVMRFLDWVERDPQFLERLLEIDVASSDDRASGFCARAAAVLGFDFDMEEFETAFAERRCGQFVAYDGGELDDDAPADVAGGVAFAGGNPALMRLDALLQAWPCQGCSHGARASPARPLALQLVSYRAPVRRRIAPGHDAVAQRG